MACFPVRIIAAGADTATRELDGRRKGQMIGAGRGDNCPGVSLCLREMLTYLLRDENEGNREGQRTQTVCFGASSKGTEKSVADGTGVSATGIEGKTFLVVVCFFCAVSNFPARMFTKKTTTNKLGQKMSLFFPLLLTAF